MNISIQQKNASIEELVDIALRLWHDVQASGIDPLDEAANNTLLTRLQAEYTDFNASFPLVVRWVVTTREWDLDAFRTFLRKYSASPPKSREDFYALQVEYPVQTFANSLRKKHKFNAKAVNDYRGDLLSQLKKEDAEFDRVKEEAEVELRQMAIADDQERRRELYQQIRQRLG